MAGSVILVKHQTPPRAGGVGADGVGSFTLRFTGDATDGTFPDTLLSAIVDANDTPANLSISGTLLAARVNPGTPAPDDDFDILLVDADGLDRLAGALLNRDTASTEPVSIGAYIALAEDLTVTVSGNATPEATFDLTFLYTLTAASPLPLSGGEVLVHDADALAELQVVADAVHMEDDPHVSTDKGVFLLGVRNEANSDLTDTDGDYSPIRVSARGNVVVEGGIAHDAVDMGNPVKVGGVYRATAPTLADGDRGDLLLTSRGILGVHIVGSTGATTAAGAPADAVAGNTAAWVNAYNAVYNGTSFDRQRGDTTGTWVQGQGGVAHDAVDSGSPVKIGGRAATNGGFALVAAGDRSDIAVGLHGAVAISTLNSAGGDGVAAAGALPRLTDATVLPMATANWIWNGAGFDRIRGNVDGTALASSARTASVDSADIINYNGNAVDVVIDVTAISATPSLVFTIQGKDALSGKYYTILASAAIVGTGTTVLRVGAGLTAAANLVANYRLPRTWRVSVAAADADSITYSVGYSMLTA